ncbi:ferritin family protein [Candidatus Bipolaricaulota bacterium]|nr:ferritin family protein [Candidatus Bipolaricaulota bacterium]
MTANILLTSLRQAMLSERDGVSFYSMAAGQAEDRGAIDLFERLADEERRHFSALQKEYQSILDTGSWDPNTAWGSPWSPQDAGALFSADFARRIQGRHMEMAALSIGLLLEKQSFEFYTQQAKAADDANVKAFFQELASWEDGHYQMLLKQDEALKDEYWIENRFAPLL